MRSFHNTIGLKFHELTLKESKCLDQEQMVVNLFKKFPDKEYTPVEVHNIVFNNSTPITSIRRAITNLTNLGILEKTKNKRQGLYGIVNYTWKLKSK